MKHISLGGLDVSRMGLGTMAMSGYYLDPQSTDTGVAMVSSWRRSSASSRMPPVARECSTAARRMSEPRSKVP